jgi:hypothetical protein
MADEHGAALDQDILAGLLLQLGFPVFCEVQSADVSDHDGARTVLK